MYQEYLVNLDLWEKILNKNKFYLESSGTFDEYLDKYADSVYSKKYAVLDETDKLYTSWLTYNIYYKK